MGEYNGLLIVVAIFVAWVLLMGFVLPKLGVPT
jgi:hypothetical protein